MVGSKWALSSENKECSAWQTLMLLEAPHIDNKYTLRDEQISIITSNNRGAKVVLR